LLERAGTVSTRPNGLAAGTGLTNGPGDRQYRLSEAQAQAILDMRLNRLTGVVRGELIEIRDAYGDARRTEINREHLDLSTEDLIEPQDVVVTLSHAGYA